MAEQRIRRRLTAIMAADVGGYGRLMGLNEAGTLAQLKGMPNRASTPALPAMMAGSLK
jgi:class 3 adenylate cyclase